MTIKSVVWANGSRLQSSVFDTMTDNTRDHDHRSSGTSGVPVPRFDHGEVTAPGVANAWSWVPVTFRGMFASGPVPILDVNVLATGAGGTLKAWAVRSVTIDGCDVGVYRTDVTATVLRWRAIQMTE